ncbi:MAG: winged helix-turn-helix domain-containing protein [Dyella sp.]|uniref:winged helix-turn-helix domain-containing protein n=1 Tax=Dyella sp. TaxID=1869338 RepID=UPI003F7E41AA
MSANYVNAAQQRVLKMLMLLAGHEMFGLAPSEIAKAIKTSPSNVTRDLANLKEAGLAEPLDGGRWRITPRMGQLALRVMNALGEARARVEETAQRFRTDI